MTPELKKAIIKSIPSYFTLSSAEQEKYKIVIPGDDDFKIKQFLLKALFDISVNNGETLVLRDNEIPEPSLGFFQLYIPHQAYFGRGK